MSNFLTANVPSLAIFTGREESPLDTNSATNGVTPAYQRLALYKEAMVLTTLMNTLSKTMVSGTIYYSQFSVGYTYTPTPRGSSISEQSYVSTGINIPIGSTGGTDTFHVGIWNSSGVLVGRSATAGATASTALTIQQFAWAGSTGSATGTDALVTLTSGTYYIGVQSNGTTAKFLAINSPIWPLNTGSQTGTAGTLPAISSIATTYTQNLGPMASLY